ncbi:MAG: type IV toxin-antitoxin system AbiEi family antitoxin [Candidatus Micrarchaeota archaeon]
MIGVRNIFEGKACNVIRVLLVNWPRSWDLRSLAHEAGVSLYTIQAVTNNLLKEKYAIRESKRGEFKLMNPEILLKRWAAYNNFSARHLFIQYYTFEQEIDKFVERLKEVKEPRYAITSLAGALQVAPYVRPTNIYLYTGSEKDAEAIAKKLDLKHVETSGNVIFVVPDNEHIFYGLQNINNVSVVSNIQLYVDLLNYAGRGEEAAGELLKKINKNWKEGG